MHAFMEQIANRVDFFVFLDGKDRMICGNPPSHLVMALLFTFVLFVIMEGIYTLAQKHLQAIADATPNRVDDVIADSTAQTKKWFFYGLSLYFGSLLLEAGSQSEHFKQACIVLILIQVGIWSMALLKSTLKNWHESRGGDSSVATAMVAFSFLGKLLIWSVILLLILDNLGVKVGSLLAGLGVGGIAVALAVQRVLGDLLASISIVLDKPFEIGDTITVGDMVGTVEHVGLKTTRLRSATGEQLILSNSDLLSSRIRNYKRMKERRNLMTLAITYSTPHEKVAKIPALIAEIIGAQSSLRFDRAHLSKLADSAIQFEIVYWVNTPQYDVFMDTQQAVNQEILRRFALDGIEFAYPTQTLYVEK